MDTKDNATETNATTIAPSGDTAPVLQDDAEARYKKLEEEKENYRKAYLKTVSKDKARDEEPELEEEDKIAATVKRELANSRIAEIMREQQTIIDSALKENRELKAARLNKEPPAAMGTHSETIAVRDGTITPEQAAYFKARNWTDKDIERYKRNLSKRI